MNEHLKSARIAVATGNIPTEGFHFEIPQEPIEPDASKPYVATELKTSQQKDGDDDV